jgi:pectate lyase
MVGITHVGDLGWPYAYESPWFKNGATDGLEIWGGKHYWIHNNTWKRMSDESLGIYHFKEGTPDLITFSNNVFIETKTASLIGNSNASGRGRVTIAFNQYNRMVNGRSPGEFRNMDAHVFNNVIGYVNDEGMRVGTGGHVISEYNVFDMGCDSAVSGPRVIRYVLPNEKPLGILHSVGDIISEESSTCRFTRDEGFVTSPAPRPFEIPYDYKLLKSPQTIQQAVGEPK